MIKLRTKSGRNVTFFIMKQTTLYSFQTEGLRVQLVYRTKDLPFGEYLFLVNRKIKYKSLMLEPVRKSFAKFVSDELLQLSLC